MIEKGKLFELIRDVYPSLEEMELDNMSWYIEKKIITDSFPLVSLLEIDEILSGMNKNDRKKITLIWALYKLLEVYEKTQKIDFLVLYLEEVEEFFIPYLFFSFDISTLKKTGWFKNVTPFNLNQSDELDTYLKNVGMDSTLVYYFKNIYTAQIPEKAIIIDPLNFIKKLL